MRWPSRERISTSLTSGPCHNEQSSEGECAEVSHCAGSRRPSLSKKDEKNRSQLEFLKLIVNFAGPGIGQRRKGPELDFPGKSIGQAG